VVHDAGTVEQPVQIRQIGGQRIDGRAIGHVQPARFNARGAIEIAK